MASYDASKILFNSLSSSSLQDLFNDSPSNKPPNQTNTLINNKRKTRSPVGLPPIDTVQPELKSIAMGINAMNENINSVLMTLNTHTSALNEMVAKTVISEKSIETLKSSNNFLNQCRLNDRLEISGLIEAPPSNKIDLRAKVLTHLKEIGIAVEPYEIADVYTQKRKFGADERFVVILIFIHEAIKIRVMRQKMQIKTIASSSVYFNDVLTPHNRSLIYQARVMKKAGKFTQVGSFNGKIYVKKSNASPKIFINNVCEMSEIANLSENDIKTKIVESKTLKSNTN